jgi:hypothetical protein
VFTRAVPSNLSLQISLEKVIILGKIPSLCCLNLENRDVLYKDKIENYACKTTQRLACELSRGSLSSDSQGELSTVHIIMQTECMTMHYPRERIAFSAFIPARLA